MAASPAVRRLACDLRKLQESGNPQLVVKPSNSSLLEWHFVLHNLPEDTDYKHGIYHGKLIFPEQYPHAPPALMMVTPNGRLETNMRLCLSMTDFHPENWNPAWTIESILIGLISFMVDEREPASYGALVESTAKRRQLAMDSWAFNWANVDFRELFPEFAQQTPAFSQGNCSQWEDELNPTRPSGIQRVDDGAPELSMTSGEEPEGAAPRECWICREDDSSELLIQPCLCRGSMSGVHASCVESWIAHHRNNVIGAQAPRCSVCNQPYSGKEKRPGILKFMHHLCSSVIKQIVRSTLLVVPLIAYWIAAQPEWAPLLVRIALSAFSASFFLYRTLVLVASLPYSHSLDSGCWRYFCVRERNRIAMYIVEAVATVVIGTMWYSIGQLPYYMFLPLILLLVLPIGSILVKRRTQVSLRSMRFATAALLRGPLWISLLIVRAIRRDSKRFVDPCDGVVHTSVPILAIFLCSLCPTYVPLVSVWTCHSLALIAGIIDKSLSHRLAWKPGRIWWIALQTSGLAVYVANLLNNFTTSAAAEHSSLLVLCVSLTWFMLVCCLSIMVNWELCVRYYRSWQHRNGSFQLNPEDSPHVSPQTIGAQAPQLSVHNETTDV